MKSRIIRLMAGLLVAACAGCEGRAEGGRISLMSLVTEPDRFIGAEVTVIGYHASGSEPPVLYITSDHARLEDWTSGIALYETVDGTRFSALTDCQDQYVMVVGRFSHLPTEQHGITGILRVIALGDGRSSPQTCFSSEPIYRDAPE